MRFSAFLGAGLVAGALFAVGCDRNNKADAPVKPVAPPAMRPGAGSPSAPVASLRPK